MLWRMPADPVPGKDRHMPIDTYTETSASRGGWPEIEPSLLEDGRPRRPVVPARRPAATVARLGRRHRPRCRRCRGLCRAVIAVGRGRPLRGGRARTGDVGLVRAAGAVAGAGRRAVQRQDVGAGNHSPAARHGREAAAARQRRSKNRHRRPCVRGAGRSRESQSGRRFIVARRSVGLARRSRPRRQDQGGWSRLAPGRLVRAGPRSL